MNLVQEKKKKITYAGATQFPLDLLLLMVSISALNK